MCQNPKVAVETKKILNGSAEYIEQAKCYLSGADELAGVNHFVVTDGLRYRLYERNGDDRRHARVCHEAH